MSEWREVMLGDVLTLQRGFDLPARDRVEGPYPIVSSSGVTGRHGVPKVEPPGVVIGRYGSLGRVHWVTDPFWPLNTALWVKDFKGNDPRFLSYLLQTIGVDGSAASAVPGVNRNHLHRLTVRMPGVASQRRIATLLAAFDEIIETNERRIELLDDLARSLYEEWFLYLRFPGHAEVEVIESDQGPIPRDWSRVWLFDIADVAFGFPFKSAGFAPVGSHAVVRIRNVPNGTTVTFTDESAEPHHAVRDGDVLIGMDGNFHLNQWIGGDAWLNQRVARIRPRQDLTPRHLMLALESPIRSLNGAIVGTTVAHLGKRHLEQINLLVPPPYVLAPATSSFNALASHELALRQQNLRLAHTRDLLLSRLVTGRLDISDIDISDLLPDEDVP